MTKDQLEQDEDRFMNIVAKWEDSQRGVDRLQEREKFDFLNKTPKNGEEMQEMQNRFVEQTEEDWNGSDLTFKEKLSCILKQFRRASVVDRGNPLFKNEPTFMLKTKRIEYTFEYFRKRLEVYLGGTSRQRESWTYKD